MACINPNSPEFKEILSKVNNPLLAEIEMDKGIVPITQEIPGNTNNTFPSRVIPDFSERVKNFFSNQGFEINYDELKNYPDFINIERGIDLIQKAVYLPSTDTIPEKEAVILGLHLLKKTVEVVNLKDNIKAWDKYTELKNKYIRTLRSNGYYGDKMTDTAEMYVLYDFVTNYFLPVYDKTLSANKTEYKSNNEVNSWVVNNLKNLVKLFTKLLKKFKILKPSYEAAELSAKKIVADILNNNINYNIPQNYELKSDTVYNSTIQEMRGKIKAIGLIETGSSTLRLLGDVYRAKDEIVNDIDSILPYESTFNLLNINESDLKFLSEEDYIDLISKKMSNLLGEEFTLVRAFVGKEHKKNKTASLTFTYKGEKLDVFVRTDKSFKNEFENDAKIIESILTNKLSMARTKDIIDYKYFRPKTELQLLRRNPAVQIFKKLSLNEDFKMKQEKTIEFFDMIEVLQEYGEDNYYNNDLMENYNNRLMNKIEKNTSKEYRNYIESILNRYITNYPEKYSKGIKLKRIFSAMIPMALKNGIISDIDFIEEKVDSKLDEYLVQWLNNYGVEIKSLKEYTVEQGISLSGVVDVINKIVYLANSEDRSVNTLAKDVSTMMLFMIGKKGYPGSGAHLVASGLKAITSYPKYNELFLEYSKLDRYKQLNEYGVLVPDVDKINYEILSIALSERLVIKHKARTNTDTFWNKIDDIINWIVNLFINKNFISLDVVTDKLANDILKSKSEYIPEKPDSYILKSYEQTLEDNPILVKALDVTFELKGTPTGSLSYRNQLDTYRDINESIHDLDIIFKFEDYKSIDDIISEYIKRLPNTFVPKFINPITRVEEDKKWIDTYTVNATLYHNGELLGKLVSEGGDLEIVMTVDGKEVPHTVKNINTDEVYKETGRDANGNVYYNGLLIDLFLYKNPTVSYVDNKKLSHYVESFVQKLRFGRPKDSLDLVLARNRRNVEPIDNDYIFYNTTPKNTTNTNLNNPTIQEAVSWIKSVMPDANIELVNDLIDDIGTGSYDTVKDLITLSEKYANKKTAKHEVFHKAFNSLSKEKQEELLDEGSKLFGIPRGESKVTVKYSKAEQYQIDYILKSIDILQSDKAKQIFEKGQKAKWDLNKILSELQIPKEQKQLILDTNKTTIEDIVTDLLANYSYTIEINTTKENKAILSVRNSDSLYENTGNDIDSFTLNNNYYEFIDEEAGVFYLKNNVSISREEFNNALKEYGGQPTQYYSNLTVPGGTNYTEQEISTPAITPSIKGHAQFATDKGIGWFRSDDKIVNYAGKPIEFSSAEEYEYNKQQGLIDGPIIDGRPTQVKPIQDVKTRRILEVQSDLFQKGRDRQILTKAVNKVTGEPTYDYSKEKEPNNKPISENQNQFLQLLNKNNNWITFFVKSIILDSAKKGYEKVLFPTGNTSSKVEGHTTLEEFKKQKEDRIKELENKKYKIISGEYEKEINKKLSNFKNEYDRTVKLKEDGKLYDNFIFTNFPNKIFEQEQLLRDIPSDLINIDNELNQLKQELERVETEGFGALKPIYNFYENTVTNILNKVYGKENVKVIKDEFGNTWNEITITPAFLNKIKLQSTNLQYIGDLAIEEKMADVMENTSDEKLPKSVLGKWIQSVRNFFRNLFKERDRLQRFMRDINQGRYANQRSNGIGSGKRYSQLSKQNVQDLFETDVELADKVYSALDYNQNIIQDNNSYYRGQLGEPTLDSNGNLILYPESAEWQKKLTGTDKGVSLSTQLSDAEHYGSWRFGQRSNQIMEEFLSEYDQNNELEQLEETGYTLIQIDKDVMDSMEKVQGKENEDRIITETKITIPKGKFKIERFNSEGKIVDVTKQQQAVEIYSQYLQSLDNPNTNPILLNNKEEQVKKFKELQERLNNKEFVEGTKNVYDNSKELQELGTQEQYIDFIAKVALGIVRNPSSGEFNDSKITDIVFHGSKNAKIIDTFKSRVYDEDLEDYVNGIYFSENKRLPDSFKEGRYAGEDISNSGIISTIVNLVNPRYFNNAVDISFFSDESTEKLKQKGFDSAYTDMLLDDNDRNIKQNYNTEIVVFNPNQIHILSSKQDVEGFEKYVSTIDGKHLNDVKDAIRDNLPVEISSVITVINEVPIEILGRDDLYLSIKEFLIDNGIEDEVLINWVGINKDRYGHPKNIKSTEQLLSIINKRYDELKNINNHPELKRNALALDSFNKWVIALERYPIAFREVMLTHAVKYLNPLRRAKYVLQLSDVALMQTYGILVGKPHELNRMGKLYDKEVVATLSDAVKHEPSASGKGYWVHIPRTSPPVSIEETQAKIDEIEKRKVDYLDFKNNYSIEEFEIWYREKEFEEMEKEILKLKQELETNQATKSQYNTNVELLRKLSPSTWCTASGMASHYVKNYDNYLLIINGITVAGIEAGNIGDNGKVQVKEVTSRANNGIASVDHIDDIVAFFEKHNIDLDNNSIQMALEAKKEGITDAEMFSDEEEYYEDNMYPPNDYNPNDFYDFDDDNDDPGLEYRRNSVQEDLDRRTTVVENLNTVEEVLQNPDFLEFFDFIKPILRNNEEIARRGVESNPYYIMYIESNLPFYNDLAAIAVKTYPDVFQYLPQEIKDNPAIKKIYDDSQIEKANKAVIERLGVADLSSEQLRVENRQPDSTLNTDLPFSKTNQNLIQGYYDVNTDKVVVVASNISVEEAPRIAIHETAHRGIVRMAKDLGGIEELSQILFAAENQLMEKLPILLNRTGHKSLEALILDYGFTTDSKEGKVKLLIELMARWAETLVDKPKPTWWRELISNIRNWITKFTGKTLSETEVNELVGGFVRYGTQQSNENTYYQKVTDTVSPFEQMSKTDQVAFEKTVRDLAARMSDRIGIPYKIINNTNEKYKGKLSNGIAYINLAYCDMSTISHEVLGHSIIRALKNKSELSFKEQLNKEVYQGNIEKKC